MHVPGIANMPGIWTKPPRISDCDLGGFLIAMRMTAKFRKFPFLVILLSAVVLFSVSGCQASQKGRKPSEDWSRGVPVGVFVRGDMDMVAGEVGESVHLVWLQEEGKTPFVHYLQLDDLAQARFDSNLDLPGEQLRRPLIEAADPSTLHLLWLSRQGGQREWALYYVQLDSSAELVGEPMELATADQNITDYVTAADDQGNLFVVWKAEKDGGLYGAQISAAGQFVQEPMRLVDTGDHPFLAAGGADLYMTWLNDGKVRFAQLAGGNLAETTGVEVANLEFGESQSLDGPVLGVTGEWAYVLWSIFYGTGLRSGSAVTEYVAFPKSDPQLSSAREVFTSTAEKQPYEAYDSAYQITQLAPPAVTGQGSDYVYQLDPAGGREDELAVAAALNQEHRLDRYIQPAILLFKDGDFAGYQMAGKTESLSQSPILSVDDKGHLYLAWREGGQGSLAYYALTDPAGRSVLDNLSGGDIAGVLLNGGMEALAGMMFFPLAGVWLIPGFLLIGLWHLRRGDADQVNLETIVVVLLAIAVSQSVKFSILPLISSYVPFSAWVDVAPGWEEPLRFFAPIFTLGAGLVVALLMRRRNPSALVFLFWVLAVDAALTLAIYGVSFLGVS